MEGKILKAFWKHQIRCYTATSKVVQNSASSIFRPPINRPLD